MSLIPLLFGDEYFRPSRIMDQHFGLCLDPDDLLSPISVPQPEMLFRRPGYYRPWRAASSDKDVGSTVKADDKQFQVNLDVQQFSPEEITVKVTGENTITIEGKHEEKQDEHGYISRHFVRRYVLPKGHDMNKIESKLSSDGILSITAPRTDLGEIQHKTIPITQTGQPMKVENKGDELKQVEKKDDK